MAAQSQPGPQQYDPSNPTPYQAPVLPDPQPAMPSPLPTQMPEINGAVKKSGAIATVADGILRGFMQGRAYHQASEVMKLKKKTDDLQASHKQDAVRLLQLAAAGYNAPNATPEQKQEYAAADSARNGSWSSLMDFYGTHIEQMTGEKKGKGKKKDQQQQSPAAILTNPASTPFEKAQAWYQVSKQAGDPVLGQIAMLNTPEAQAQKKLVDTQTQADQGTADIQVTKNNAIKEYQQIRDSQPAWPTIGSPSSPQQYVIGGDPKTVPGLKLTGNVNINYRPSVDNPETGGKSSVWSTSFGTDKGEILVPRVTNGEDGKPPHILSEKEAKDYYDKYHKFLGIFDTPEHATAYAKQLHEQQAALPDTDQRIRQLEDEIVPGEKKGSYAVVTGKVGDQPMSLLQNKQTGEMTDLTGQALPEATLKGFVADKSGSEKSAQVKRDGKTMVSITDPSGKSWTPDEIKAGEGGAEVQALYKSEVEAEDKERADSKAKADVWYSHANYSDTLQTRRALRALGLRASAADIKEWSKREDIANTAEEIYQEAAAVKEPTSTSDQKLLISWVRSNNPGTTRLPESEIKRGLVAGDYTTRAQNAWDQAIHGTLAPELHKEYLGDIRNAAQSNREEADDLKDQYGLDDDTLKAIAEAQGGKGSGKPESGGKFDVTDPKGKVHHFDSQAQADDFKKLAGIK